MLFRSDEFNLNTIKPFRDNDSYAFLELYKLLSRSSEGGSIYHRLPESQLHRVTLVFMESGKWFMLNLGTALSYAESAKNVTALVNHTPIKLTDKQMAVCIIRMILSLNTARAEAAKKASDELAEQERQAELAKDQAAGKAGTDTSELEDPDLDTEEGRQAVLDQAARELAAQEVGQTETETEPEDSTKVPEADDLDDHELVQVFGTEGVKEILARREIQIEEDIRLL